MYNESGIYVYKNKVNGKLYVGQAKNLKRRYERFKNENGMYSGQVLENARKKYGIESFEYSILTHCPISELNYWEAFYVNRLNTTTPNGYNMTSGGDSAYSSTQEFKDKVEKKLKEKILKLNPTLDVSDIKYVDNFTPVKIVCREHGDFYKTPNSIHNAASYGGGLICPSCIKERVRKKIEDTFFERVAKKYGDEYVYDKTIVTSWSDKITVTCRKHGDFSVRLGNHISKDPHTGGCPLCSEEKQHERKMEHGSDVVKNRILERFGSKYSLDDFAYNGDKEKVTLICEKHGPFSMRVFNLLRSYGCPKCREEMTLAIRKAKREENELRGKIELLKRAEEKQESSQTAYIERATRLYNGFYDYSKTSYTKMHEKITITCPIHGDFEQLAYNHLNGYGCPKCGQEKVDKVRKRKVLQISLSGDIVKTWNSVKDITINGKRVNTAHISSCCSGKRKTAFGFKWKHPDSDERKILQIDKEGNVVKVWNRLNDIHREKPIKSTQHILRCLNKQSKTAGGFQWRYED